MGKVPDMPEVPKREAAASPESSEVTAAGQRMLEESRNKQGRMSTLMSDPYRRTGFSTNMNTKTGSTS